MKTYENQTRIDSRVIISQMLTIIRNLIDKRDSFTSGHSARVAACAHEIARHMGLDDGFLENLFYIGLLHDVGKVIVPNEIINKPAKLTDDEYAIMKKHTSVGKELLEDVTFIRNLTAGASEHHERWDGKGYGQGISGEDISLEARIIAVADTYDAMSEDRPYRKALPKEVIIEEFTRCSGAQFDPQIIPIITDLIERDYFKSFDMDTLVNAYNHHD
ncbi:MAG: HD-GYP domain-containing protein [Oscillospiraceae bacterium]|nr:HD-GYP domain-containing protein [Oscillospiraceae bacterium]